MDERLRTHEAFCASRKVVRRIEKGMAGTFKKDGANCTDAAALADNTSGCVLTAAGRSAMAKLVRFCPPFGTRHTRLEFVRPRCPPCTLLP